jgi:hypothetical protein
MHLAKPADMSTAEDSVETSDLMHFQVITNVENNASLKTFNTFFQQL